MKKINQEEYEMLKGLDDKWKWVARDERHNSVCVHSLKPIKEEYGWTNIISEYNFLDARYFQFIQWEDEEPYNIAELIEEYESEEAEVKKNIEWLKEKVQKRIDKLPGTYSGLYIEGSRDAYHLALKDIDQLDEPEALSDKWIDEHAKAVTYDGIPDQTEVVYADDLQNLLVPKQELPVIPQFVADHIEDYKKDEETIWTAMVGTDMKDRKKVSDFLWNEDGDIKENHELFVRAWLDGYTVEEKKYRVILETRDMNKEKDFLGMFPEGKWYVHLDSCFEITGTGLKHTIESFTEQEIKDYDERYWPFAVKVEELEE